MVSLKSFAAFLALGVLSATAAPANDLVEARAIATRQNTVSVYVCEHANWRGACKQYDSNPVDCVNVSSDWDNRISAIQLLQKSSFNCAWFEHHHCTGLTYHNQEDANLADGNGAWNDRISSWRCTRNP